MTKKSMIIIIYIQQMNEMCNKYVMIYTLVNSIYSQSHLMKCAMIETKYLNETFLQINLIT